MGTTSSFLDSPEGTSPSGFGASVVALGGRQLSERDPLLCSWWGEAYIVLDAQLRAVELLARRAECARARAHVERRVARLDDIRDALHLLHSGIDDAQASPYYGPGSPFVAYLVGAHLWCRQALEHLRRHAHRPLDAAGFEAASLAERSDSYVASFLEPTLLDLIALCDARPSREHALGPMRARAEQVHQQITRFCWARDGD